MAEEKKIVINYQGKEVKAERIENCCGQYGEIIYDLQRKNCKVVFNSTGEKNVIAVTDQYGKVNWLGTYSSDIKIQSVDLVMFKEGYMTRYNGASVVDAEGIRYEVPDFNYFENELISEETDEEIDEEPVVIKVPSMTKEEQAERVKQVIADLRERSGLTD